MTYMHKFEFYKKESHRAFPYSLIHKLAKAEFYALLEMIDNHASTIETLKQRVERLEQVGLPPNVRLGYIDTMGEVA